MKPSTASPRIVWPEGKRFVFTVFDDPDSCTLEGTQRVYGLLSDLGLRTTMGVWPLEARGEPNSLGETCMRPAYRDYALRLAEAGFEIGFHNAAPEPSSRERTIQALDAFRDIFGADPQSMANHYNSEAIYWGAARLSGNVRRAYNLATLGRRANRHYGHVPESPYFWGDVCRQRIRYCRNFVYPQINTLAACPWMPYHDSERPYVNLWFASSEGAERNGFVDMISEANQDRLEEEGGCSILYTHFGRGFYDKGPLDARFQELIRRLSGKNGWFVPVSTLLDFLGSRRGEKTIALDQRAQLEWRWLRAKIFQGTT